MTFYMEVGRVCGRTVFMTFQVILVSLVGQMFVKFVMTFFTLFLDGFQTLSGETNEL